MFTSCCTPLQMTKLSMGRDSTHEIFDSISPFYSNLWRWRRWQTQHTYYFCTNWCIYIFICIDISLHNWETSVSWIPNYVVRVLHYKWAKTGSSVPFGLWALSEILWGYNFWNYCSLFSLVSFVIVLKGNHAKFEVHGICAQAYTKMSPLTTDVRELFTIQ